VKYILISCIKLVFLFTKNFLFFVEMSSSLSFDVAGGLNVAVQAR